MTDPPGPVPTDPSTTLEIADCGRVLRWDTFQAMTRTLWGLSLDTAFPTVSRAWNPYRT